MASLSALQILTLSGLTGLTVASVLWAIGNAYLGGDIR